MALGKLIKVIFKWPEIFIDTNHFKRLSFVDINRTIHYRNATENNQQINL